MSIEKSKVEKEYQKHQKITPQDILSLREWLKTQPHLSEEHITDLDLILAYHSCNYSSQVAKQVIDLNFTLRTKLQFLQDRTPDSVETILKTWLMVPLPAYSKKGNQIILIHLLDSDPKYFVHLDITKSFTMVMDLWQYDEGTKDGVCVVIDMDKFTWPHMRRTNLTMLQQFFYFSQEATFLKLKEIHIINAPEFTFKMYNICAQFVNKTVLDAVKIHPLGSDSMAEFISKKSLPKELGGEYKDVSTLRDEVWNKIVSYEKYFMNESKRRVDESKRPADSKLPPSVEQVTGTFKQLEID